MWRDYPGTIFSTQSPLGRLQCVCVGGCSERALFPVVGTFPAPPSLRQLKNSLFFFFFLMSCRNAFLQLLQQQPTSQILAPGAEPSRCPIVPTQGSAQSELTGNYAQFGLPSAQNSFFAPDLPESLLSSIPHIVLITCRVALLEALQIVKKLRALALDWNTWVQIWILYLQLHNFEQVTQSLCVPVPLFVNTE